LSITERKRKRRRKRRREEFENTLSSLHFNITFFLVWKQLLER
jgi:hypothetical protein